MKHQIARPELSCSYGTICLLCILLLSLHRATLVAGLLSIVMLLVAIPVGSTAPWMTFANWMLRIAKAIKG